MAASLNKILLSCLETGVAVRTNDFKLIKFVTGFTFLFAMS